MLVVILLLLTTLAWILLNGQSPPEPAAPEPAKQEAKDQDANSLMPPPSMTTPDMPPPLFPGSDAPYFKEIVSGKLDADLLMTCPEGMALIPQGEVYSVWKTSADGISREHGKPRLVESFCMDQFEYPNHAQVLPRTMVSYLEAEALCEAASKRLCAEDEWELACSGPEENAYSYGPQREAWRCNTDGITSDKAFIVPSGSHPGCRNQHGVYDLNGNVSEWVKDLQDPEDTHAWIRGGTAWVAVYGQSCFSRHQHGKEASNWTDDGFRCCAEPKKSPPASN